MANAKKTTSRRGVKRTLIRYSSYMFIDKDPIMDAIKTARIDAGMSFKDVQDASRVPAGTQRNWEYGNVKRPQFATASAVIRALGKKGIRFDDKGRPHLID